MLTRLDSAGPLPLAFGFLAGNATLVNAWGIVDVAVIGWGVWVFAKHRPAAVWPVMIVAPVAVSFYWSLDPIIPAWTSVRFMALALVALHVRSRWDSERSPSWIAAGFVAGIAMQTLSLPWMFADGHRPALSFNASVLGQSGLVAFMLGTAARDGRVKVASYVTALATLAVSQERSAMVGTGLFAVIWWRRDTLLVLSIATLATLAVAIQSDLLYRWDTTSRVGDQIEKRADTYVGGWWARKAVTRHYDLVDGSAPSWHRPEFTPGGYGYGQYVKRTGTQRPHNVLVVIAYDLGWLSVPVLALIGHAVVGRRLPWAVVIGLLGLWMLVDDPWSIPPGHYQTAAVAVALWISRRRNSSLAASSSGALEPGR